MCLSFEKLEKNKIDQKKPLTETQETTKNPLTL